MTIKEGEVVSIIGPSGSGKSTLLNIIEGLDTPSTGYVRVADVDVSALSISKLTGYRRKYVGHVFQRMNLVPTLTAAENFELPMLVTGKPRWKQMERSRMLLDAMGVSGKTERKPGQLSGGEQQRVAVAVALANDPPLILADEPTGELDTTNAKL